MKTHIKKLSKTLLFGLVIFLILTTIYLAIPKYQIHSVRLDKDTVVITKINTITGDVSIKRISSSDKIVKFPWDN